MNKSQIGLLSFILVMIALAVIAPRMAFHDSYEYITIAKNIGGIQNVGIFSTHSILHPAVTGMFLKIWPNFTTLRIINTFWVIGIALLLYYFWHDKKAFFIFALSPLTWFMSIQTTPVLSSTFFLILSFMLYKKVFPYNRALSGIALGLAIAFYTPLLLITALFILIYFWKEKFSAFFAYSIAIAIGILPRFIIDWWFFDNPFFTFIRYIGANAIVSLGLNPTIGGTGIFDISSLLAFFVISPLLFMLYTTKNTAQKRDLLFATLIFVLFLVRTDGLYPFFIVSPIFALLLAPIFTTKNVTAHAIISMVFILFFIVGHFSVQQEKQISSDLAQIIQEYTPDQIIAGPFEAVKLASYSWDNSPEFIWYQDYRAAAKNETYIRGYSFSLRPKRVRLVNVIDFSASFNRYNEDSYNNILLVTLNTDKNHAQIQKDQLGLVRVTCKEILCVYQENKS
jgi:hypothetical protein